MGPTISALWLSEQAQNIEFIFEGAKKDDASFLVHTFSVAGF